MCKEKIMDEKTLSFLRKNLYQNPSNYEMYLLLGSRYADTNPDIAYLSYENAEFYCERNERVTGDLGEIAALKEQLRTSENVTVSPVSIVILSCNTIGYTKACVESIRMTLKKDTYEVIVVENASTDGSREWLEEQSDIRLIVNQKNVGFPAGCNQGIQAASEGNDIFLLNSDTVLFPNSLFYLRMGLYWEKENGMAGAISNLHREIEDFPEQKTEIDDYVRRTQLPSENPYEQKAWMSGFALLIRRNALKTIGCLDEDFTPGYFEDNDLGVRMLNAGFRNVMCYNSFIFHYGSKSFEQKPETQRIIEVNKEIFMNKWGFHPQYYAGLRTELIRFIPAEENKGMRVLEVGCGCGETLGRIKYLFPESEIYGIEIVDAVAEVGHKRFETIIQGNVEFMDLPYPKDYFDYVIFGDVLEHLTYPEAVLTKMHSFLKPGGRFLTSIPNLMNAHVIYDLLRGRFTYKDSGILDRTHMRFFTYQEILEMFRRNGYVIDRIDFQGMAGETTDAFPELFEKLLGIDGVANKGLFDTYQFLVLARRVEEAG